MTRLPGRTVFLLVLVLAMAATGAASAWVLSSKSSAAGPTAPPWRGGASVPCRQDPMAHVHEPTRLVVVAACATASGRVVSRESNRGDGDELMTVALDPEYRGYLAPANQGLLVVEVIPTDLGKVTLPVKGDHAIFYGAWVLDRDHDRWAEVHPAWHITVDRPGPGPRPPVEHVTGTLAVDTVLPEAVPIGSRFTAHVGVRRGVNGTRSAASEADVFMEIVSQRGVSVRWRAARTNTMGLATISMVALDVPGRYTVWTFAHKGDAQAENVQTMTITRR